LFDELSNRLEKVFKGLRSRGVIGEKHLRDGLREVRLALLEADGNYKVVKDFAKRVEEKTIGSERIKGISPGHHIIKIVHQELTEVLGESRSEIHYSPKPPTIILLVGLQGSGKTTTSAKLATYFARNGKRPYLIAADTYRPAAREQLTILAKAAGVPVYSGGADDVLEIVESGTSAAGSAGSDIVIIDSAGRLHCDRDMVMELRAVVDRYNPSETLLVIDGMTGQDAVNIADTFHKELGLTGVILTKMEGDARGGAALSIHGVTGCPIKFVGTGEGLDDLEVFYPERMASRILNMGDIVTLVEKAQRSVDSEELKRVEEKVSGKGEFDLSDYLTSLRQLQKMGPLNQLLDMVPGVRSAGMGNVAVDPGQISRVEAIILSMTLEERMRPELMNGSRRLRVARGSGTSVQEVNRLLNQFRSMKKLFRNSGNMMKKKIGRKEIKLWQQ